MSKNKKIQENINTKIKVTKKKNLYQKSYFKKQTKKFIYFFKILQKL